jgi:hypothetical protein
MRFNSYLTRLTFLVALITVAATAARAAENNYHADPTKIVGPQACAECHAPMVEAWKLTHHFDTFNTMHRRPEAREIAGKMGMRRIKDESLCLKCHYTAQTQDDGRVTAIAGISCESCHGAARDWIKVHSDKKDPDALAKAVKLGMLQPSNYYAVAANCFGCHTVPEEKLVNVGGHKAGSDFELVSWVSGEVRHNLQKSAGKVNEEIPVTRQRMFMITGRALDLEFGLRGLAKATEEGAYAKAMLERVNQAKGHLEEIQKAANLPEIKGMLDAVVAADLKVNNEAAITKMADAVGENARKLADSNDGSKLAAIDSLLPAPDKYKGAPYKP